MVANAGTNLPRSQRILVRGVVADQQHRFGFVELLHRQHRISGALAEGGDQTGIIHGAMMIDVVGTKGRASEALEEIIFFVGSAVRTYEADRIRPVGVENLLQFGRGGFGSLFPRNRIEFVALANQRLLDAFGMFGEIEAKAAFYAEEIAVNAGEVAIIGTQDLV